MGCTSDTSVDKDIGESHFINANYQKDGLDVYYHKHSYGYIFFHRNIKKYYCPLCNERLSKEVVQDIKSKEFKNAGVAAYNYGNFVYREQVDIFDDLERLHRRMEVEKRYMENLLYKYKCTKTGKEIYLKLYTDEFPPEKPKFNDSRYEYHVWSNNPEIKKQLLEERKRRKAQIEGENYNDYNNENDNDNAGYNGKISSNGYFKGKRLCGTVQVVNNFADFKVQVVDNFPDLKVKKS